MQPAKLHCEIDLLVLPTFCDCHGEGAVYKVVTCALERSGCVAVFPFAEHAFSALMLTKIYSPESKV